MDGIIETNNGLAYDFGVAIAQGATNALAVMATKVITLTGSVYALMDAGRTADEMLRKNQLQLGGYANYLKAIDYFSQKVISGQSYFDVDNLLEGSKALSRAGLDFKQNFDLINKAAQGMGTDFANLSHIIQSGDYSALAEAGLITQKMATYMDRTTFTAQQGTRKVLALLKQADAKGLFKQNVATVEQTIMRLKEIYNSFMRSIIGDIKDPEGFWYNLRKIISEFADFFANRMDKIRKIGQAIGKFLTWTIRMVSGFVKYMYRFVQSIIGNTDNFFSNWQEKMLSFGLWLEILRVKIKDFFLEYEGVIFRVLKTYLMYKAVTMGGAWMITAWARGLAAARMYFGGLSFMVKRWKVQFLLMTRQFNSAFVASHRMGQIWKNTSILSVISNIAKAAWAWTAAMLANPITWIVAGVVALVAAVYLLWKYWNDIREYVNGVSDKTLLLITVFFPLVGLVMTMAKYWNEIKTIAQNVWQVIVNLSDALMSVASIIWKDVKGKFSAVFTWLKDVIGKIDGWFEKTFGDSYRKFKTIFIEPIKLAFSKIKEWISDAFDIDLGKGFNKIIDWTKELVKGTSTAADQLAKVAGRESFASSDAVSLKDTQKKEVLKLIREGKTDEEIRKIMDNGNFDLNLINEARKEVDSKKPLDKIPTPATRTKDKEVASVSQSNNFNLYISKDVDIDKVIRKVNETNNQALSTRQRQEGVVV